MPLPLGDPFGLGWNPFGLPRMSAEPGSLHLGAVWHVEVVLILAGHVASVYSAHLAALRGCALPREAGLVELAASLLMVSTPFWGWWY